MNGNVYLWKFVQNSQKIFSQYLIWSSWSLSLAKLVLNLLAKLKSVQNPSKTRKPDLTERPTNTILDWFKLFFFLNYERKWTWVCLNRCWPTFVTWFYVTADTYQLPLLHAFNDHEQNLPWLRFVVVKGFLDGHQQLLFCILIYQSENTVLIMNRLGNWFSVFLLMMGLY